MNNERYNQIIDEVHRNYSMSCIKETKKQEQEMKEKGGWNTLCLEPYFESKEKFIGLIKTDPEFSERWGLKIEERELSDDARNIFFLAKMNPLKQITVTYKGEKIEVYE